MANALLANDGLMLSILIALLSSTLLGTLVSSVTGIVVMIKNRRDDVEDRRLSGYRDYDSGRRALYRENLTQLYDAIIAIEMGFRKIIHCQNREEYSVQLNRIIDLMEDVKGKGNIYLLSNWIGNKDAALEEGFESYLRTLREAVAMDWDMMPRSVGDILEKLEPTQKRLEAQILVRVHSNLSVPERGRKVWFPKKRKPEEFHSLPQIARLCLLMEEYGIGDIEIKRMEDSSMVSFLGLEQDFQFHARIKKTAGGIPLVYPLFNFGFDHASPLIAVEIAPYIRSQLGTEVLDTLLILSLRKESREKLSPGMKKAIGNRKDIYLFEWDRKSPFFENFLKSDAIRKIARFPEADNP